MYEILCVHTLYGFHLNHDPRPRIIQVCSPTHGATVRPCLDLDEVRNSVTPFTPIILLGLTVGRTELRDREQKFLKHYPNLPFLILKYFLFIFCYSERHQIYIYTHTREYMCYVLYTHIYICLYTYVYM